MCLLLGLSSALLNTILFTRLVSTGGTNNNREENKILLLSNVKLALFQVCLFAGDFFSSVRSSFCNGRFKKPRPRNQFICEGSHSAKKILLEFVFKILVTLRGVLPHSVKNWLNFAKKECILGWIYTMFDGNDHIFRGPHNSSNKTESSSHNSHTSCTSFNNYHLTERTNVPRSPCLNSCSESHFGKREKNGLKWTCRRLWGFICLFWPWRTFGMYSGYTQTNLSQSGRLEMVLRKYLQLLPSNTIYKDLPQNCHLIWAAREKDAGKISFQWVDRWHQTLT